MNRHNNKGGWLENKVAARIRHKLGAKVYRDKRSGAGPTNSADIVDYFRELPLHVEVKNQETVKIKEWFRQADDAASVGQAPAVVFAMEEEVLATLRLDDLLNFLVEIADLKAELDDWRKPVPASPAQPQPAQRLSTRKEAQRLVKQATEAATQRGSKLCREGHIVMRPDGRCSTKGCKYGYLYKPPKGKKR